ncbi:MAG: sigma-70 family RNA polymerase sigma factor [Cyclobacteriaceae bacterium]|nr:sigma-70 family RNA polymerase sigma factor [Cyclobacteriaceae bacterium]
MEKDIHHSPGDEQEILKQAIKDRAAFRPIYEKYFKDIFLFVHRRVGDKQTSADITQQVFLKALTQLDKFQFRGVPFSAWLYRISLNECHDYFRKTKKLRYVVVEDFQVDDLLEEMKSEEKSPDLLDRLQEILQKLSPPELELVELRYFETLPFRDIAEIYGITENHAKVRLYRVLAKLKKIYLTYEPQD